MNKSNGHASKSFVLREWSSHFLWNLLAAPPSLPTVFQTSPKTIDVLKKMYKPGFDVNDHTVDEYNVAAHIPLGSLRRGTTATHWKLPR